MSDPGTVAYVKAMDAQVFKDINTGSTVATLITPVGAAGGLLGVLGPVTGVAAGIIEDQTLGAIFKEGLQAAAGVYLQKVYGLSEALTNRIVATIDLAGGWQAFISRTNKEIFEVKK